MEDEMKVWVNLIGKVFLVLFGLIILSMIVSPIYNVWAAEQSGKAQLAEAEYSKQVAVQTAIAKADSAKYEANAEVTRAEGVAKANKIIGDSLEGNEAYLRYLWVNAISLNTGREIIYIPTEANLPVVEAGRLGTK
jgi:regulator of protease activity HflC (stomatin/prohibitin superfamily)